MEKRFDLSKEFARKMDLDDPLKDLRARFYLNENEIYMDGNSLGLLSKDAEESLMRVLNDDSLKLMQKGALRI